MAPLRQRLLNRAVLIGFVGFCMLWLSRLDYGRKISTNILDLIPDREAAPEIAVLRSLAGNMQTQVMLFALGDSAAPATAPLAAARAFAARLRRTPQFAQALVLEGSDFQTRFGRELFDQRYRLLLPSWIGREEREFSRTGLPKRKFSRWLADRAAADLAAFLARPEAVPAQELVARDPLLLVARLIESVQFLGTPGASAGGNALVWARISASPLAEEGQGPVFAVIAQAEAATRAEHPGLTLLWSGVNRFAAASRARIESEIKILNVLSILAVLAVGSVFLRQFWKILLLLPVIACALLGGWTASTMVFSRVHLLVFAIGSLLSGVAVDYGIYIYLQPPARPEEGYGEKLRRLLKPLLASCLTTVIGFSLLLWSNLPFIRQVGFFVSAGLLCALGSAMLYFGQFRRPFLEARRFGRIGLPRNRPGLRRALRLLFVIALLLAVSAPWRLRWQDDVHELDISSPGLLANEERLRALFGENTDRSLYLTFGRSPAEARSRLEAFTAYQSGLAPPARLASLGLIFPTEADWRALPARLGALAEFGADFRSALQSRGFDSAAFGEFFEDWDELRMRPPAGDYAGLYRGLDRAMDGPLAQLYQVQGPLPWFITIVDRPDGPAPSSRFFTISLNELQSLNRVFTRYRWSALRLSLIGLGLVIASVFIIYPSRPAARIALIPAGSCFFVLGVLALAGVTLNLFHLLSAFLGLCLAHNYAIFSSETAQSGKAPAVAVRLSAACAGASFAVLACSRIPVVHAIGATVFLIVLTAMAAVELEPFARGKAPSR